MTDKPLQNPDESGEKSKEQLKLPFHELSAQTRAQLLQHAQTGEPLKPPAPRKELPPADKRENAANTGRDATREQSLVINLAELETEELPRVTIQDKTSARSAGALADIATEVHELHEMKLPYALGLKSDAYIKAFTDKKQTYYQRILIAGDLSLKECKREHCLSIMIDELLTRPHLLFSAIAYDKVQSLYKDSKWSVSRAEFNKYFLEMMKHCSIFQNATDLPGAPTPLPGKMNEALQNTETVSHAADETRSRVDTVVPPKEDDAKDDLLSAE